MGLIMQDERRELAVSRISSAALKAINSRGTDEYAVLVRKYLDVFRNELIYYLCPQYDRMMQCTTVTPEEFDVANQVYMEIISDNKTVLGLVENYDETNANYGFEGYFRNIIKIHRKAHEKQYENANARTGVVDVFTERESRTLRKIIKMCENYDIENLTAEKIELICQALNIDFKTFNNILYKNRNAGATHSEKGELDFALSEFSNDGNGITHKAKLKPEGFEEDNAFEELLLRINSLFKDFPENVRAVYPSGFTGLFIEKRCDEVKEYFALANRDLVVENHFEDMRLPDYRDYYANGQYVCMCRDIFDISIENRVVMMGKDIAEILGISTGQFSKLMKKGENIIRGIA